MTGTYTANVGLGWIGWRWRLDVALLVGELGQMGEGVFSCLPVFDSGDVGQVGEGVLTITPRPLPYNHGEYNLFHVSDRRARAFPILSLYIYYFLFSFLQSRRGKRPSPNCPEEKETLKREIKKKRGC